MKLTNSILGGGLTKYYNDSWIIYKNQNINKERGNYKWKIKKDLH